MAKRRRKICGSCRTICFASDEICSRCGSNKLALSLGTDATTILDADKLHSGGEFEFMKKFGFWVPCIVGVLLNPIFLWAGMLSGKGAASHAGAGLQLIFFFPIPFFLAALLPVPIIGIGLAILQYPFFGFFISYARTKAGSVPFALIKGLIWAHVIISLICLLLVVVSVFNN